MEKYLYEIIAAHLSKEALSQDEQMLLQKWLNASAENREIYAAFEKLAKNGESLKGIRERGHTEAWSYIENKCKLKQKRHKRIVRNTGIAAAVSALLVSIGFSLLVDKKNEETSLAKNITESHATVQLLLSNGQNIPLSNDTKRITISDEGHEVICDSNKLDYRSNKIEEKISYNTLIVPIGTEYSLVLSDGTKIYINADSELRYPTSFQSGNREVFLNGEAYFEVTKDKAHPFIVKTDKMNIEVLGTSFNVNAYSGTEIYAATLTSGKIQAICENQKYDLRPGQQLKNNNKTGHVEITEVNTDLYTSWKDGYYYFEASRLEDIMQTLSRWYGIETFFQNSSLKDIEFTGRLKRYENISQLFRKFERMRNIHFHQQGNTVIVSKK